MRPVARQARERGARPRQASSTSHRPGPMQTNTRDEALTVPMVRTTSANQARGRATPRRAPRGIVSPTSHGSAAHASRITEIRAVNASW